jgi:flagellar biosynthetic protein FlhB
MSAALAQFLDHPEDWRLDTSADALALFQHAGGWIAIMVLPAVALLMAAGILSSILQNPPRFVLDRIAPTLSRIALDKGWSRVFGTAGQVEFLKSCFKIGVAGSVGLIFLQGSGAEFLAVMHSDASTLPEAIRRMATDVILLVLVLTCALVAADLLWSRFSWVRDLRMTPQEVKDEVKDTDGNPFLKARIRSLQRDRARRRMIQAVPRATLVIANPTHYAVALRYIKGETQAPKVLAKGRDLIALKIREIAEAHEIPVIEDKRLARSLYDSAELDRLIPPEFYRAVAEIILFLQGRRPRPRPQDE